MKSFAIALSAAAMIAPAAAIAQPVSYDFDRSHTEIRASWDHQGYSRQAIQFTQYDGDLLLDLEDPSNSTVDITFTLVDEGFWVGAHHERFIAHLNSDDFFLTDQFPTARFVATSFETEDGVTGTMTGELTIRDLTHPVTLEVTLNKQDETRDGRTKLGFSATGTLLRSEWGMGFAIPNVSDEVILTIETELVETPEAVEEE
ncbi:YceI family protein [Hyphobacterium marinum]|uniref:YceI family protein n=1 Tax=Hyphobacterium marinum TaxID=3116574 RepID=A0ABU7LYR6_9PROT|nr:YceI family protein [Hyphobacterium sp. Y6023]MEE2566320.1 YceI family protein [Hyphobacterium sp. Y6023]